MNSDFISFFIIKTKSWNTGLGVAYYVGTVQMLKVTKNGNITD